MRKYYYEDARWPWRADEVLRKHVTRAPWPATREQKPKALDLGMGYGRNAIWLAERGYEVEGWEKDAQYVREARQEWQRRRQMLARRSRPLSGPRGKTRGRPRWRTRGRLVHTRKEVEEGEVAPRGASRRSGSLIVRQGDFTRARFLRSRSGQVRGRYDAIVLSCVLHMMRQSVARRVLRRAKTALTKGGRLFLLVKLTHDRRFRQFQRDPAWQPVRGERNTLRHRSGRAVGYRGHRGSRLKISPVQSRFEPGELRRALRGLRVVHFREVVLRSEWEHPRPVTHTVAEVAAERK